MILPVRHLLRPRAARLGSVAAAVVWLVAAAGLAASAGPAGLRPTATPSPSPSPVPTYTNADLERLRPYRHQVGGGSVTSAPPADGASAAEGEARERAARERYWRREAERHRERVLRLRERMAELHERLARERSRPPRKGQAGARDHAVEALEARIERLRTQLRELESRFEERARREGALPGWLR